jgi:hypothetical protein
MNYKRLLSVTATGRIPLDIRCPSPRRIRDDRLDRAFQRIFERHGDLQCLHHFPLCAFSVLPGFVRKVVRGVTSTDNITRYNC